MNLKKKIHDDIWEIIEGNDPQKPSEEDWILMAFQLLLEGDKFMVDNAYELGKFLKKEYENIVNGVEDMILKGNGEVLPVLKSIKTHYDEKIQEILDKLKHENKRQ